MIASLPLNYSEPHPLASLSYLSITCVYVFNVCKCVCACASVCVSLCVHALTLFTARGSVYLLVYAFVCLASF